GETARRCEQINCDAGDRFGAGALWLLAVLPLLYLVGSALTIASLTLCVARLPRYGIVAAAGTAAALFGVPVVVFTAPALHAMEVLIPPLPITLAAIVALDSAARPARADATSALPTSPDDVSRVRAWPSD
ncbi:MAG: hypothetical protein KDB35_14295, partial [Acidimicrobiales bacterium]|nr:hypothetical protein [Acidimicrobiales bacterium]